MSALIERGPTLLQVRQELEQLFAGLLGTYTLPDGSVTPAVWVSKPNQLRPDWAVAGVEMVIEPEPERSLLGEGRGALPTLRTWTVTFNNFDTTTRMSEIRLQAFRAYPNARQGYAKPTDTIYERLTLELLDPVLITPL